MKLKRKYVYIVCRDCAVEHSDHVIAAFHKKGDAELFRDSLGYQYSVIIRPIVRLEMER